MTIAVGENLLLRAALEYAGYGWRVVVLHSLKSDNTCSCREAARCDTPGKHPRSANWPKEATSDPGEIERIWTRWPKANLGVAMGQASGLVDFECDSSEDERILLTLFGGDFPVTACYVSSRGKHWLFRWRADLPGGATYKIGSLVLRLGNNQKGAQSVFPPSIHGTGIRYAWKVQPSEVPVAEIPDTVLARIWNWEGIENCGDDAPDDPIAVATEAVKWLPRSFAEDYHQWLGVGMALKSIGEEMLPVWDEWSKQCPEKYEPGKCSAKWKTFDKPKQGMRALGVGSLIYWARQAGWQWKIKATKSKPSGESLADFALRAARRSPNIDSPTEQADLFSQLEWHNSRSGNMATDDEIRGFHTAAIAAIRKEQTTTKAVGFAYTVHGLKYEKGLWLPGEWKLTIVLADPVEYRLFVPRWASLTGDKAGLIRFNVQQYRDADAVAALVQSSTRTIVLDDTPGQWSAIWNGTKGNKKEGVFPRRGLKALLIDNATTEVPPAMRKRFIAVAEIFQELLERAKPCGEKDEPSPRRAVIRTDGTIWFRWRPFWREAVASKEVVFEEVTEIARRLGLCSKDYPLWPPSGEKRKRYCVITQALTTRLKGIIEEREGPEEPEGRAHENSI